MAQIGFDVLVERQVEATVDPGGNCLARTACLRHFPLQPSFLRVGHLEKRRGDYLVLGLEMPVERSGAQLGTIQDGGDAAAPDSCFAQGFEGGGDDSAAHVGVWSKLASSPRTGAGHPVAS